MAETVKIGVCDIVGTGALVDTGDGQKVHEIIASNIAKGNQVILSFAGTTQVITAFLNAAIGQLYNEFDEAKIRRHLRFSDLDPVFSATLTQTIRRAKEYFADPARIDTIRRNVTGHDD